MDIKIVDPSKDRMSIDGYEFFGFWLEETCNTCGHQLIHSLSLDAKFCPKCNEWRESPCGDPNCMYCGGLSKPPIP